MGRFAGVKGRCDITRKTANSVYLWRDITDSIRGGKKFCSKYEKPLDKALQMLYNILMLTVMFGDNCIPT